MFLFILCMYLTWECGQGESILPAAAREVFEETGVRVVAHGIVAFRHQHQFSHSCSDVYVMVLCTPADDSAAPNPDLEEVATAEFMPLREFVDHVREVNDVALAGVAAAVACCKEGRILAGRALRTRRPNSDPLLYESVPWNRSEETRKYLAWVEQFDVDAKSN